MISCCYTKRAADRDRFRTYCNRENKVPSWGFLNLLQEISG